MADSKQLDAAAAMTFILAGNATVTFRSAKTGCRYTYRITKADGWHEGRCGRCGRKLTVPESIEAGYGPECINLVAA